MIMVRVRNAYRGVNYEIEMSFEDLKVIKDVGPIIDMIEKFIDRIWSLES